MESFKNLRLLNKKGEIFLAEDALMETDLILLYFTASWCNCYEFTQKLVVVYKEAQKRNIPMKIIYISCDTDEQSMMEAFRNQHGDWYVVPYEDTTREEIRLCYGVTGIPVLIVLKKSETIPLTMHGKEEIENIGINVLATWW